MLKEKKNFYSTVVIHSDTFLIGLEKPSSTLVAKRLADKLLAFYRRPAAGPAPKPLSISQREMSGLQYYISGYVIGKILKKTKNQKDYKSKDSQAVITALSNMLTDNIDDQHLIKALSRGGLKAVKFEIQSIFTEEKYRIETNSGVLVPKRKIDTKKMVACLLKNTDVRSWYSGVVSDSFANSSSEIKENLLEKMLKLYLRVRAFSTAKDTIQKYKNDKKKKAKKETGVVSSSSFIYLLFILLGRPYYYYINYLHS